jgi:glycosyltransferase involved in cell wall biosynthesis
MSKIRLLITLPSLRGGGAERVATHLARHLDHSRFDVHVCLAQKVGPFLQEIPSDVEIHDLNVRRTLHAPVPLANTIRRLQPHVVLSMVSHMNLTVALTRPVWPRSTRFVLRETSACQHFLNEGRCRWLRNYLYRRQYNQADAIICQTRFMQQDLQQHLSLPAEKLLVIRNPIDVDLIEQSMETECRHRELEQTEPLRSSPGPHIVTVSAFRHVKGIDRLIRAFPNLLATRPNAHLWLAGQGPLESQLRRQVQRLGLSQRVHFVGFQRNPYSWMRHADLLVIPSRYESCSNTLLEALVAGIPVVAMRHPGGTGEILRELGLADRFVEDLRPWSSNWFRTPPGTVRQQARDRYSLRKVVSHYERLIQSLATPAATGKTYQPVNYPVSQLESSHVC